MSILDHLLPTPALQGTFLSESPNVFVITPKRCEHFSFRKLKILILVIFKAALASPWPYCPCKPLSFKTLRHPQFLSNFQSPKFKCSSVWNYDNFISIFWQKHTSKTENLHTVDISSRTTYPPTTSCQRSLWKTYQRTLLQIGFI